MRKIDLKEFQKFENDGWIFRHEHKTLPLIIWNYSQKTQYEGFWLPETLMCRGLVTDTEGNIIANGFQKFFNYEEHNFEITGTEGAFITEKMDGSFIMIFKYDGQWIIMSKGSFYSDQVAMTKQILSENNIKLEGLPEDRSYCFEVIHPENRIICNYGNEKSLVYLSSFYLDSGKEVDTSFRFDNVVKEYDIEFDYDTLKNNQRENAEGYVIRLTNGMRFKIKFEDYKNLHFMHTRSNSNSIHKALSTGTFSELIKVTPDESYDWIKKVENEIMTDFNTRMFKIYEAYQDLLPHVLNDTEKEFWQRVTKIDKPLQKYMFLLRQNNLNKIIDLIWKEVKPEFKTPYNE